MPLKIYLNHSEVKKKSIDFVIYSICIGGDHENTVKELVDQYNVELDKLRSQFENSLKTLQEKYRSKVKDAFLN